MQPAGHSVAWDLGRRDLPGQPGAGGGLGGQWLGETDPLAGKACGFGRLWSLAPPKAAGAHGPPSFQVYETPFYVAVDHDKKKVVISIRGTLSPKVGCLRLLPTPGGPPSP